jgi:CHAT domain-containing protein
MSRIFCATFALLAVAMFCGASENHERLSREIEAGRCAVRQGRFAEAEARFNEVLLQAGNEAPDTVRMVRLNLALLFKCDNRLDEAVKICTQAIAENTRHGTATENARTLVPFRIVLAGVYILQRKIGPAESEVSAAKAELQRDRDQQSVEVRELLHLEALLQLVRFKQTFAAGLEGGAIPVQGGDAEAETLADNAERLWRALLPMQDRGADPIGEARTYLYLSQLSFFRWQARALREAADDLRNCRRTLDEFKKELAQHKAAVEAYDEDREKQILPHKALKAQCEKLNNERERLKQKSDRLRALRAKITAAYDAVRGGELAAGKGEVPRDLANARRSVETALAQLKEIDSREDTPADANLHYVALCHRAAVLRACAPCEPSLDGEVKNSLVAAVNVLETPRAHVSGEDVTRADFLFPYSEAFDQLIEWHRRHQQPEESLIDAELCRNRALLDCIRRNEGDHPYVPRSGFGARLERKDTRETIRKCVDGKDVVLYYHMGLSSTYLFVIGLEPKITLYRLGMNGPIAGRDQEPNARSEEWTPQQDISAKTVEKWGDEYAEVLKDAETFPTPFRVNQPPRDVRADPVATAARLADHADLLLPDGLPWKLAAVMGSEQKHLLVSVNKAIQQVPLEALWIRDKKKEGHFFIDLLPPAGIAYVPSLTVLDRQEKADRARFPVTLVTAARRNFDDERLQKPPLFVNGSEDVFAAFSSVTAARRKFDEGLPELPLAVSESEDVFTAFSSSGTRRLKLTDHDATKAAFFQAVDELQPSCIHLATHCLPGFAPELVLASGNAASSSDGGGRLTAGEIASRSGPSGGTWLENCRLAVLSACSTNQGKKVQGEEMPMSSARSFLAAGAHRVVASQWAVDDGAAKVFATSLLGKVAADWNAGRACDYAAAVNFARHAVIETRRKAKEKDPEDPFYWAPFILIGPPCDGACPSPVP